MLNSLKSLKSLLKEYWLPNNVVLIPNHIHLDIELFCQIANSVVTNIAENNVILYLSSVHWNQLQVIMIEGEYIDESDRLNATSEKSLKLFDLFCRLSTMPVPFSLLVPDSAYYYLPPDKQIAQIDNQTRKIDLDL